MSQRSIDLLGMTLEVPTAMQLATSVGGVALLFAVSLIAGAIPSAVMPPDMVAGTFLMSTLMIILARAGMDVVHHPLPTAICIVGCISLSATVATLLNLFI